MICSFEQQTDHIFGVFFYVAKQSKKTTTKSSGRSDNRAGTTWNQRTNLESRKDAQF